MKKRLKNYQVVPFPKVKRLVAVAHRSVQHTPMIHLEQAVAPGTLNKTESAPQLKEEL